MSVAGLVQEAVLKGDGGSSPLGISTAGSGGVVSVVVTAGDHKTTTAANKRPSKTSFVRTGSFRNKHKLKGQESLDAMSSSNSGRGRSPGDTRTWRIRHFGYYDIQSVSVDRLGYQLAQGDPQQRLKKHTGASAALLSEQSNGDNHLDPSNDVTTPSLDNELVALCPSFTNEIGGDWSRDTVISKLRDALSDDKKLRLYSRERVVLDGHLLSTESSEMDSTSTIAAANNNDAIFTVQSGLTFPLEFIDYGACYYRHHFYDKGIPSLLYSSIFISLSIPSYFLSWYLHVHVSIHRYLI